LLYDLSYLSVADVSVLEKEVISDKNHDVFVICLRICGFLGKVDDIGGFLWGVVSFKIRISLHKASVTGKEWVK
jgi:hypothetical protein